MTFTDLVTLVVPLYSILNVAVYVSSYDVSIATVSPSLSWITTVTLYPSETVFPSLNNITQLLLTVPVTRHELTESPIFNFVFARIVAV